MTKKEKKITEFNFVRWPQGFLYWEVGQIGSITKNPKILVTSHSRRILKVRVTKYIYSLAMLLVTLKSHFYLWNTGLETGMVTPPPLKTIWRFFAKPVLPRKQALNLTVVFSKNVHFEHSFWTFASKCATFSRQIFFC